MPLIKVLMAPPWLGMRIFDDLKDRLQDAIFRVIGDMVPKEEINITSEFGEETDNIQITIGIYWTHPQKISTEMCAFMVTESQVATVDFLMENYPGKEAVIQATSYTKE